MNDLPEDIDDIQALERRLAWATASTVPAPKDMDPRTAALREAWTHWGRLLESAETPMEPSPVRRTGPAAVRRRWLPVGAGLAAASLAVVAAATWGIFKTQPVNSPASLPQTVVSAEPKAQSPAADAAQPQTPTTTAVVPQAAAKSSVVQSRTASAAEPKWNDTVDDELVQASEKVLAVQQDWHARADAFDSVRSRLERIHSEIDAADGARASPNSNPNEEGC